MKLSIAIIALLEMSNGVVLEKKHKKHAEHTHPVPNEYPMLERSEYPSPDIRGP